MTEKKMDIVARGFHGKWIKVKRFQKVFFIMSPIQDNFKIVHKIKEVNSFNRKWLAHGGIPKTFFLDHFSPSFLSQKY